MFNFRVFIPCFVFSISIIPFDVTAQDELVFRDGFERCELAGKVPVDAIRWGGGGDGASWSDVLNWEGGVLPGDGDLVSIRVEGDVTVIYDSSLGTTSIKTLDSCESLTVSGGTLQLNDDSRVKANLSLSGGTVATATSLNIGGSLQHSGGILTGSGTVTVAGVITWTGGNQSGSGETIANGGVTMTNDNDKVLVSRTLTLKGDTVWAGDVRMRDAATINSHAAFDIQTDHPIGDNGGALSSFYNYGMLTKSAGTGRTEIRSHVFNHGTITVNTGTLSLGKPGTLASSEGKFEAAPAATLELRGDHTMLAASSFSGAGGVSVMGSGSNVLIQGDFLVSGLLEIGSGTLTFDNGPLTLGAVALSGGVLTSTSTLDVTGSFQLSAGALTGVHTVTVAGLLTWTGGNQSGSGETIANGGVSMTNGNDKVLVSRTLTLNGDTVWAGDVRMRDAATINSHAAFDIRTDHPIGDNGGALSSFYNYGTLTKSTGTGRTEILSHVFNHGTITVTTGTLSLGKPGTLASSDGAFEAAPAATLELRGDHTMLAGSSFSGAGGVSVMGVGSNVLIQGDFLLSGLLEVGNGTLTFDTGPLTLGAVALSGGVLTSTSTLDVTGSFQLSAGALTGVHAVTVAGLLTWTGGNQSGLGETVANGNVIMTHGNDKVLISRTLTLNGDSVWSGDVRMADAATINSNAAFDIQADFPLSDSGGALSTFNNNGTLTKSSGAGNSEFRVDFVNTGNVSVTTGSTSFDRAFTQESGGTLTVGIESSVVFDNYNVSQSATLDGTLDISLLNGFEPELDEMYVIMNFASRSGVFAEVNGLIIGNGKKFDVIYAATNVTLKVVTDT